MGKKVATMYWDTLSLCPIMKKVNIRIKVIRIQPELEILIVDNLFSALAFKGKILKIAAEKIQKMISRIDEVARLACEMPRFSPIKFRPKKCPKLPGKYLAIFAEA